MAAEEEVMLTDAELEEDENIRVGKLVGFALT
jgi:hypothetical protein